MISFRINKLQFILGVLFLLTGTIEYIFSRPPGSAYFLIPFHSIIVNLHDKFNPFGQLGFLAPDFFHPLAFALMCMALLRDTFRHRLAICLAWLGIDMAFEFAQNYGIALVTYFPGWMGAIPLFNKLTDFCIYGTYDPLDLLAISAGALTAFFIGHMTRGGKTKEQTA